MNRRGPSTPGFPETAEPARRRQRSPAEAAPRDGRIRLTRTTRVVLGPALAMASMLLVGATPAGANGATQVSGATSGEIECPGPPEGFGTADYVIPIDGDLTGCIYGVITEARCHPGGTYQEVADEIFVKDGDPSSTFELTEFYTAKFDFGEPCDFGTIEGQQFGRCKHPIVSGSGTGEYEGVSGRLDFKDDVDAGTATYTGHLRYT